MGELVGREAARRLGMPFGIVDLSLAPTPAIGDSVADILELIGVERTGAPGTTAALALLTDAVKKGGAMASSSSVGGLSGAFIPVSEDAGMIEAGATGALSLDKLEAMTAVCSVGLDMVAVPGDTPAETIAGDHRRRDGDRHGQPQDHRRAHHPGRRARAPARRSSGAACSGTPDHPGEPAVEPPSSPRRTHPGAAAGAQQLTAACALMTRENPGRSNARRRLGDCRCHIAAGA